jgi:hypothetical protein
MHCFLCLQWILSRDMKVVHKNRADWQTHIQAADTCLKWIFKIYYTDTRFKFRPSGKQYHNMNVEMVKIYFFIPRIWKRFSTVWYEGGRARKRGLEECHIWCCSMCCIAVSIICLRVQLLGAFCVCLLPRQQLTP